MRGAQRRAAVLLSVWALLLGAAASALAQQIVDDLGTPVRLAQPARRVVSLLPSLTETVCALGACERLVGVDRYSNFPARVEGLPRMGGGLDPQVESIVAARPDLVLIASSSPAVARLRALGLTVAALEPRQYADARRVLEQVGLLLGVGDAPRVWAGIEAGVQAAARELPARARGQRVYFEVNEAPYAAGEASFIGETLALLELRNIVPRAMGPFPRINPEFVVRADPDLVMVGDTKFTGMAQRPGWSGLRALRTGHVCVFDPAQSDLLVRPGPRMAEAARVVVQCLRRLYP